MLVLRRWLVGAVHHVVREDARAPAMWRATISTDEGEARIVVRNVSRSGFMGITAKPIPAGARVTLALPFGKPVIADVRWALNGRFGCRLRGRFDWGQLVFLSCCGLGNGLFTGTGLRTLAAAAAVAVFALA